MLNLSLISNYQKEQPIKKKKKIKNNWMYKFVSFLIKTH